MQRIAGSLTLQRSFRTDDQCPVWPACIASFLICAAEARSMDVCSYEECSSCARDNAEQVGLPRDARLARHNAPENEAIQDTNQQRRAQRDRRAIHQAAHNEEAEPAEDQP